MVRQSNRCEDGIKAVYTNVSALETTGIVLETTVTALDGKVTVLDGKVTVLDGKLTALDGKSDVMGRDVSDTRERLARMEGHLMAPEGFRLSGPQSPAAADPPPDAPGTDQRQAG